MQNEVSAVMVPRPGHDRCRGAACCAPTLRSGGVTSGAPGAGSESGGLLERPAERGLGVVPHLATDRGDLGASLGQEVGGDLHPPLSPILHRGLTVDTYDL